MAGWQHAWSRSAAVVIFRSKPTERRVNKEGYLDFAPNEFPLPRNFPAVTRFRPTAPAPQFRERAG